MNQYMVNIYLPRTLDENFVSLIPYQRAQVNKLMQKGSITSYTLSADRSRLWTTVVAESRQKVMDILRTFPLFRYMEVEIFELMFHENVSARMPAISLN